MSLKATITPRGAIILGKYVACDAFDGTKPLRVVTHAHADHMMGLQQSLKTCQKVLMTKATKDLIDVMRGPLFLMGGFVETLDYGKTIHYEEERITFSRADHILGAAQVLVEDAEGTRIVYTGDFRIDGTLALDADILVMEATYGNPSCKRSFDRDVKDLLISLVKEGLKSGAVQVFGYHGKLQEVMQILRDADVNAPFIAPERVLHVSKVCENHGMRIGRLIPLEEREAVELLKENSPCIIFYHMNAKNRVVKGALRIYVSGWEFDTPCREIAEREYIIALSDHSDFDDLMEYVRRSKPKLVITDNFRIGHADKLAKEISKRFGISALPLPKR
ncbi:MAG: MBL fold metallo-hydrolase [Candidatus Bathyarchaeota archaeon]|nr:MBL fold metallo-hydrolase [Candidatus Bathyarchaeota archaeon]